jgi:hypothetical protein
VVQAIEERTETDELTVMPGSRDDRGGFGVRQDTADFLWRALVLGLLVILAIAVVGLIVGAERNAPRTDELIAPVTAILSGVLALFVHPPTHSHHTDG